MYFLAIGLAYLVLEIAFLSGIQRLLGDPVIGGAATVGGFLLCSGLGSLAADRIAKLPGVSLARLAMVPAVLAIPVFTGLILLALFGGTWLAGTPSRCSARPHRTPGLRHGTALSAGAAMVRGAVLRAGALGLGRERLRFRPGLAAGHDHRHAVGIRAHGNGGGGLVCRRGVRGDVECREVRRFSARGFI